MRFISYIVFPFVYRHLAHFQMKERTEMFWDAGQENLNVWANKWQILFSIGFSYAGKVNH